MAAVDARSELDRGGEAAPPLELDKANAQPGDQVHIRLHGPAGGIATVSFILLTVAEREVREGPQGA